VTPTFMKIDVEGAAELVLSGATGMLQRFHPLIDCSTHSREEEERVLPQLMELGYRGVRVVTGGRCDWIGLAGASLFLHPRDARVAELGMGFSATSDKPAAI
jgi:hypothetical protein